MKANEIDAEKVLFNTSWLNLCKQLNTVTKDAKNPFHKSSYASLNAHLDLVKPICEKEGFSLSQRTTVINTPNGPINVVLSEVLHASTNIKMESSLSLPKIDDMQKLGSAITYARRYTLSALFSLGAEDDDGNSASGKTVAKSSKNNTRDDNDF